VSDVASDKLDSDLKNPKNAGSGSILAALRAYTGPNWDSHYGKVFASLLKARVDGTSAGWTWNWPAAIFPGWFLYRRLYLAFFVFLLIFTLINVVDQAVAGSPDGGSPVALLFLALIVIMGVSGDRLLFRKAYSKVTSTGTDASAARLAGIGRPHKWLIWLAVAVMVVGVLAAILVPVLAQ
jgi:hypothetical protein